MFDSANWQLPSMQRVVGGGLGLDEVKCCYCLEVSNPTQNKEDGRNVLRSPISALKAAEVHTNRHAYKYILCVCARAHMCISARIHTGAHASAHYTWTSYTQNFTHTNRHALMGTNTSTHAHTHGRTLRQTG